MPRPRNTPDIGVAITKDKKKEFYYAYPNLKHADGTYRRRHVRRRTPEAVRARVGELQALAAAGRLLAPEQVQTLGEWAAHWLEHIAPIRAGHNTMETYSWATKLYIAPRLGHLKLVDEVTVASIEQMYSSLLREGLSPKSIELIWQCLATMLGKAKSHGLFHFERNPATEADRPRVRPEKPLPFEPDEVERFISVARERRNLVRWLIGFHGPRSGEVRGLKWSDVDWERKGIWIRRGVQTRVFEHGCDDLAACAVKHCRIQRCLGPWEHGCADACGCARSRCRQVRYPSDGPNWTPHVLAECTGHTTSCPDRRRGPCRRHTLECPEPCEPGCTRHASHCPKRIGGTILVEPERPADDGTPAPRRRGSRRESRRGKRLRTKTDSSERFVSLPELVMLELGYHKQQQEAEKERAGEELWEDNDLIICDPFGRPIARKRDWEEWTLILELADIEHLSQHAGTRDTAATIMLALGIDRAVIKEHMGWTSDEMLDRYAAIKYDLRADAAARLGTAYGFAT